MSVLVPLGFLELFCPFDFSPATDETVGVVLGVDDGDDDVVLVFVDGGVSVVVVAGALGLGVGEVDRCRGATGDDAGVALVVVVRAGVDAFVFGVVCTAFTTVDGTIVLVPLLGVGSVTTVVFNLTGREGSVAGDLDAGTLWLALAVAGEADPGTSCFNTVTTGAGVDLCSSGGGETDTGVVVSVFVGEGELDTPGF